MSKSRACGREDGDRGRVGFFCDTKPRSKGGVAGKKTVRKGKVGACKRGVGEVTLL